MASKRLAPLFLSHATKFTSRHSLRLLPPLSLGSYQFPSQRDPPPSHGKNLSTTTPSSPPTQSKPYTFKDIQSLASTPHPSTLLIDVREPSELDSTGRIPSAVSMPIVSNPDAIYLSPDDFEERFGFPKPGSESTSSMENADMDEIREQRDDVEESQGNPAPYAAGHGGADVGAASLEGEGEGVSEDRVKEVVFYCKAGVRSRAAMQMAQGEGGWKGVKIGQWAGGWVEWKKEGGKVER
ncbi:MAG: hypothetical protein Q9221_001314 [Calogaya cf. arnoldii]